MTNARRDVRFPGESAAYRAARNQLLDAEIDLRRRIEAVAEQRRNMPLGGEVPHDYVFDEVMAGGTGKAGRVKMSELFAPSKSTLVLYSFMFGPEMNQACASCTSILDALDGEAPHIVQRVNLAVVGKSPIERLRDFARGRGWRNLRLLSSASNTYNRDYHGETGEGGQLPSLNVFVRRDGVVRHFYNTELLFVPPEKGQDGRHVDLLWPLWNLFDLTPEGRGSTWHPRLTY